MTWTNEQERVEYFRKNPIFGTNLDRPMHEIIREIRSNMTQLRGQITDFQFGYPSWKERTEHVEGLLTCGIVALWHAMDEMEKFEKEKNNV